MATDVLHRLHTDRRCIGFLKVKLSTTRATPESERYQAQPPAKERWPRLRPRTGPPQRPPRKELAGQQIRIGQTARQRRARSPGLPMHRAAREIGRARAALITTGSRSRGPAHTRMRRARTSGRGHSRTHRGESAGHRPPREGRQMREMREMRATRERRGERRGRGMKGERVPRGQTGQGGRRGWSGQNGPSSTCRLALAPNHAIATAHPRRMPTEGTATKGETAVSIGALSSPGASATRATRGLTRRGRYQPSQMSRAARCCRGRRARAIAPTTGTRARMATTTPYILDSTRLNTVGTTSSSRIPRRGSGISATAPRRAA